MSRENLCMSYVCQLFHGDKTTKSWTHIIDGQVAVHLRQREGGAWWIMAAKKQTAWEKQLDANFKHRVKENFVQWHNPCGDGEEEDAGMSGLRFKNGNIAKQFGETIDIILSPSLDGVSSPLIPVHSPCRQPRRSLPLPPPCQVDAAPSTTGDKLKEGNDQVLLRVHIADEEVVVLNVSESMPLQKIMKSVCLEKQLDPSLHVFTQTSGPRLPCTHGMTVGDLNTYEISLLQREMLRPAEMSTSCGTKTSQGGVEDERKNDKEEDLMLLQVELPQSQHTFVRVSPSMSMEKLLTYVCEKRNMDLAQHQFYLPDSPDSLEGRSLQDFKIDKITVVTKEIAIPETTHAKTPPTPDTSSFSSSTSPSRSKSKRGLSKRNTSADIKCVSGSPSRVAPLPPPQRRRTQPDLMRELATEMVGRKLRVDKGRTEEDGTTGVSAILDRNGVEFASDRWNSTPLGKELSPHKGREDEEGRTLGGETLDGIPGVTRSAFRSKKILKPRTTPPPLVPPHNTTPTTPDGETTPTFSLKRDGKELPMGVDPLKKPILPPPTHDKSQMKLSPKQKNQFELEEPDLAAPTHAASMDGGEGEHEMRGLVQVKKGVAGAESSITSALMDQTGNRLGRCTTKVRRDTIGDKIGEDTSHHPIPMVRDSLRKRSPSLSSAYESRAPDIPWKPKGPAPLPPPHSLLRDTAEGEDDGGSQRTGGEMRRHSEDMLLSGSRGVIKKRAASSLSSLPGGTPESNEGEGGKAKKPSRKAPCRPPPSIPVKPVPLMEEKEKLEMGILDAEEDAIETSPITKPDPEMNGEAEIMDSNLPHAPSSTLEFHPSNTPPADVRSSTNRTPQNTAAVLTICKEATNGGKLLIIKPSPGSTHKTRGMPIIFKLPPPPPQLPTSDGIVPLGVGNVAASGVLLSPTGLDGEGRVKKMEEKSPTLSSSGESWQQQSETNSEVPPGKALEVTNNHPRENSEEDNGRVNEGIFILGETTGIEEKQRLVKKPEEPSPSPSRHYSILKPDAMNPLSAIVRDEHANLDDLMSHLPGEFVTTDFSVEENLEPPKVEQLDSGSGMRINGTGNSSASLNMSDSDSSRDDIFQVPSMDEEDDHQIPTKMSSPHCEEVRVQRIWSNQSPNNSPKHRAEESNMRGRSLSSPSRRPLGKQGRPPRPVPRRAVRKSAGSLLDSKNSSNNNNITSSSNSNITSSSNSNITSSSYSNNITSSSSNITSSGNSNITSNKEEAKAEDKSAAVEELYLPPAGFEGGKGLNSDSFRSSTPEVNFFENCESGEGGASLFSGTPGGKLEEEEQQEMPGVTEGRIQERCVGECSQDGGQSTPDSHHDAVFAYDDEEVDSVRNSAFNKLDSIMTDIRNLVECSSGIENAVSILSSDRATHNASLSNTECSNSIFENTRPDSVDLYSLNSKASPPTPLNVNSDLTSHTFISDAPPPRPTPAPPSLVPLPVSQSSPGPVVEKHPSATLATPPPLSHTLTHADDKCNNELLTIKMPEENLKALSPSAKGPPLLAKPAKRHSRKKSNDLTSAKDELLQKLKERLDKMSAQSISNCNEGSGANSEGPQNLQSDSNSSSNSVIGSTSDDVQTQLQYLQQRVLQQQICLQNQYQQLLAMNPGMGVPGMGNVGMGPGGIGMPMSGTPCAMMGISSMCNSGSEIGSINIGMNPGNWGMSSVEVGMNSNEGVNIPGAGINPFMQTSSIGVGMNIQGTGMNSGNVEMSSGGMGMNISETGISVPETGMQTQKANYSNNLQVLGNQLHLLSPIQPVMASHVDPVYSCEQEQQTQLNGPIPVTSVSPTTSTAAPVFMEPQGQPSTLQNDLQDAGHGIADKSASVSKRSKAIGHAENTFDQLMDDIRDTNLNSVLRKAPWPLGTPVLELVADESDESSYTGMGTALPIVQEDRRHSNEESYSYGDDCNEDGGDRHDRRQKESLAQ